MKSLRIGLAVLAAGVMGMDAPAQCGGNGNGCCGGCQGQGKQGGACAVAAPSGEKGELTDQDRAGILFMREEEKLARDVYRHLGRKWELRPFQNIQHSEQIHFDAMGQLIARYELTDPAAEDVEGVFVNQELKTLFAKLIADGEASALVEEIDIEDLDELLATTQNPDLKQTAQGLRNASGNHLRAFVRNLTHRGVEYEPSVLAPAVYAALIGGGE